MIVTSNLRMLRAKYNKTQKDMADVLGVTPVSYRQKENNIRPFTLEEAKKISDLFKLTVEEIFFKDEVHTKGTA